MVQEVAGSIPVSHPNFSIGYEIYGSVTLALIYFSGDNLGDKLARLPPVRPPGGPGRATRVPDVSRSLGGWLRRCSGSLAGVGLRRVGTAVMRWVATLETVPDLVLFLPRKRAPPAASRPLRHLAPPEPETATPDSLSVTLDPCLPPAGVCSPVRRSAGEQAQVAGMGEGSVARARGASEGSVALAVAQDRAEDAQTALSPNRGPIRRSIDIRMPAVARRVDEIDMYPV